MSKDFSKYKLNVTKSPVDPRVFKAKKYLRAIVLPEILDYRGIFNEYFPVFDQGTQGSCAACAGTAMRQWQEFKDTGMLKKFSEQFIYNNRENQGEEGMYMLDLMKILYKVGICLNSLCKYGDTKKPTETAYKDALKRVIEGYAQVETIDEFKLALYTKGPCVIAVPVYNYTDRMWYKRTGDSFLGGHAMCCVGYNKDGFIIRNSWGKDWSSDGYTILPYGDFNLIWEAWTTIDAPTDTSTTTFAPTTTPENEKSWLGKYWLAILIVLGILTVIGITVLGK